MASRFFVGGYEEDTDEVESMVRSLYGYYEEDADEIGVEYEGEELTKEEVEDREEGEEEREVEGESVEFRERLPMPNCPLCMEVWTSEGPHRVCALNAIGNLNQQRLLICMHQRLWCQMMICKRKWNLCEKKLTL